MEGEAAPQIAASFVARRLTVGVSLLNACTHGDLVALMLITLIIGGVEIKYDTGVAGGVEP